MVEKKTPGKTPAKTKKPVIAVIEHDGRQFIALEDVAMMLGINPEPVPANIAQEPEEPIKNPDCEPATKGYAKGMQPAQQPGMIELFRTMQGGAIAEAEVPSNKVKTIKYGRKRIGW